MSTTRAVARGIAVAIIAALTRGCASQGDLPLMFGQTHSVGLSLSLSGSTTEQGVDLALGFKDKDLPIVPIDPQAEADGGANRDALSTFCPLPQIRSTYA